MDKYRPKLFQCVNIYFTIGSEGNKQDVPRILSALQMCISRLPRNNLRKVEFIGVCGQMHGCMLWNQGESWERKPDTDR